MTSLTWSSCRLGVRDMAFWTQRESLADSVARVGRVRERTRVPRDGLLHIARAQDVSCKRPRSLMSRNNARWLSDAPRASDVEKRAKDVPPPPPNAPRKPKVALHPAPIRPAPTKPPPAPPATKDVEVKEKAAAEGEEGIVAMTRRDLQLAQEHGVLLPPPVDAGRIGKLWHQVKELFVSIGRLWLHRWHFALLNPNRIVGLLTLCHRNSTCAG